MLRVNLKIQYKSYEWLQIYRLKYLLQNTTTCMSGYMYKCKHLYILYISQFSSVTQSCPTVYDPIDCRRPGLPVYSQLPEFTPTLLHWVSDAIQSSHPLSSPSPPAFLLIQRLLAIWSLVPLPLLKPAWISESSQFTCCWSLAWRILSITLLVCETSATVR